MDTATDTGLSYANHNRGIHTRVMALAIAPAAVLTVVLTAYFIHTQLASLQRATQRRGERLVQELAAAAENSPATHDHRTLAGVAAALREEPGVLSVALTDAKGATLLQLPSAVPQSGDELSFRSPYFARPDNAATMANAGPPGPAGWAEVHLSGHALQQRQQRVVTSGLLTACLALAVSALLAVRFGRAVIRPELKLREAVRAFGEGRFEPTSDATSSDELRALERGVEQMGAALKGMQHSMQSRVDQATQDLLDTLAQLETKNRMLESARLQATKGERIKSEFLANISHEIRTPMNAITGFTNLLLKTPLNREQRDYACTVRDSANSLLTVINDILDFSRIAAGDVRLDRAPFDLREVVDGALAIMAPAAYDKGLDLVLLFCIDVPELLIGDAVRVRQMLMSLIGNAVKFTRRGRIVVRVMIEDETADRIELRISVQDTGVGLGESDRERLFAAFAQADSSAAREVGGVGIGLVICKQLAEQMGGTTGLESTPGEGSTFWFSLRAELQTDAELRISPLRPFAGVRAALYELDELQRTALTAQLEAWGIEAEPIVELDRLESRLAASDPPRLAFLGLRPEELEDHDIANFLNRRAGDAQCAVVVLMSTVNRRLLDEATAAGAAIALPKIVPRSGMRAILEQALNPGKLTTSASKPTSAIEDDRPPDLSETRVLVVDDHVTNRKLMCTLYAKAGATVDTAADGEEALRKLASARFDLIFMDIQMPGMNGMETLERIRGLDRGAQRTPVIAVTAAVWLGERERLIRAGFDDCVMKPVHENELWEMAYRWLDSLHPGDCEHPLQYPYPAVAEPDPEDPYAPRDKSDRTRAIRIAGGNEELAQELFTMLLGELPEMRKRLNSAFESRDFETLESEAHKLHGAASYCAVEPLRSSAARVERAIKNRDPDLEQHMETLRQDMERLLAENAGQPPDST